MTPFILDRCRRWNFEATDSGIMVCRDHHDKGQPCEYERMSPQEAVQLIEDLKSAALRASRTSAMFAGSPDTITANDATDHWLRQEPIYPLVSAAPTQRF